MDGCDDCVSGTDAPNNDGVDFDMDGLCDAGDPDDDNDLVPDAQGRRRRSVAPAVYTRPTTSRRSSPHREGRARSS
jgi:hypothetical protein